MTQIVRSIPGDLLVQGLAPDAWNVVRFNDKMESISVSSHPTEDLADAEALRLAKSEHVNVFKPSGDGVHLAPFYDGRGVKAEWLPAPGAVHVRIDHS